MMFGGFDRGRGRRPALVAAGGALVVAVLVVLGLVVTTGASRVNPLTGPAGGEPGRAGPALVGVRGSLPSGEQCAQEVRRPGDRETRPSNATANATEPRGVAIPPWGDGYDPRINTDALARIDGRFTGTTDEILAWGACKWGMDADVVRAVAMEESEWRQSLTGDVSDDEADCVAGESTPCPTSFGILQVRWTYRPGSYPSSRESTAFNVDYALAVVRACYDGDVTYLQPDGYRPGDLWGCLGWHYSGEWRDDEAEGYIERVGNRLTKREWTRF